jgi:hypothetical protein
MLKYQIFLIIIKKTIEAEFSNLKTFWLIANIISLQPLLYISPIFSTNSCTTCDTQACFIFSNQNSVQERRCLMQLFSCPVYYTIVYSPLFPHGCVGSTNDSSPGWRANYQCHVCMAGHQQHMLRISPIPLSLLTSRKLVRLSLQKITIRRWRSSSHQLPATLM